jgi:hypothetical protein
MPKTKQTLTTADNLRRFAGYATGARWADALDAVNELEAVKDAADTAADALEELDSIVDQLTAARDAVSDLAGYQLASADVFDYLSEATSAAESAQGSDLSAENLRTFVEAWDNAQQALETYGDTKEQDPYPGKGDEVRDAWETAQGALEDLAEAYDNVEIIAPQEESEPDA